MTKKYKIQRYAGGDFMERYEVKDAYGHIVTWAMTKWGARLAARRHARRHPTWAEDYEV